MNGSPSWPDQVENEGELEELLSRPGPPLINSITSLSSPLLILGAGGKMGPTLARMARRAATAANHSLEVITVSRFSDEKLRNALELEQIKTIACDLLDAAAVKKLPASKNVLYLVGLKFGTAKNPAATWALNTIVPARVMECYSRARIVALSSGNVYPFSPISRGGAVESDPLTPLGEYPNAAVGRERVFEFFSQSTKTPLTLLRLFYAVELRYGVLVDLAQKVFSGQPIDLATGHFNCIWQGDANEMTLRSFALTGTPPTVWNLSRPEIFSVRETAAALGELLGRKPVFVGEESPTALLGNSNPLCEKIGQPLVRVERMLGWIAHWLKKGGRSLGRPTHFEVRDGRY